MIDKESQISDINDSSLIAIYITLSGAFESREVNEEMVNQEGQVSDISNISGVIIDITG